MAVRELNNTLGKSNTGFCLGVRGSNHHAYVLVVILFFLYQSTSLRMTLEIFHFLVAVQESFHKPYNQYLE